MNALVLRSRETLAELASEHPEAWVVGLSAGAWVAMAPHLLSPSPTCHQASALADVRDWCLMVVAMMVPLVLPSVRWTAARAFRSRQHRAMGGYLLGYLAPWAAVGVLYAAARGESWAHAPWLAAAAFGLGALWARTQVYERWMSAAHRTIPLAATGWRAEWDCVRMGLRQAVPCIGTCGLLMVGCALTGHGALAMLGGAVIGALERRAFEPRPWSTFLGGAGLAVWYGWGTV